MYKHAADFPQKTAYVGNNMKNLHCSVEASLKKLRTSYIDILYLHWVNKASDPLLLCSCLTALTL